MGGGGGGSMFTLPSILRKNTDIADQFSSAMLGLPGLSEVAGDEVNNFARDPMNLLGTNPGEVVDTSIPAVKKVDTKVSDLEESGDAAALAETERLKKRKGYKSTVLTSMAGDLSAPTTLKQTLGGA